MVRGNGPGGVAQHSCSQRGWRLCREFKVVSLRFYIRGRSRYWIKWLPAPFLREEGLEGARTLKGRILLYLKDLRLGRYETGLVPSGTRDIWGNLGTGPLSLWVSYGVCVGPLRCRLGREDVVKNLFLMTFHSYIWNQKCIPYRHESYISTNVKDVVSCFVYQRTTLSYSTLVIPNIPYKPVYSKISPVWEYQNIKFR